MPIVADFAVIVPDHPVTIGDANPVWEGGFYTRTAFPTFAVLFFNIQHLTHTNRSVVVRVNNKEVGRIWPYSGEWETARNWYTQMVTVYPGNLLPGDRNELQIEAVRLKPEDTTPDNVFDDFKIKNVVCLFQEVA